MNRLVLFLMAFLCIFMFSCSQADKPILTKEIYCDGLKSNQLVLKTYEKYVEVNWRYKLTMRISDDGKIAFLSPNYNYPDVFQYIKNFPWDGTADIPTDGSEVIPVRMPDGKFITVVVYNGAEKMYLINYKGIYNFKFGCSVVQGRSLGTALENSKFKDGDLFNTYPFATCGP